MRTQLPKTGPQLPPPIFGPCLLWPNYWMDQLKIPLGTEVGITPGDTALDGDAAPPLKGAQPPIFGGCLLWPNGWMDEDATCYGGRPRPRRHCVRWEPSSPPPQRGTRPVFGPCLLCPNGRPSQLLPSSCR